MKRWLGLVVAVAVATQIPAGRAGFLLPDWEDPPLTTDVLTFADNANPAYSIPALSANPFGAAEADIVIGDFGEGWFGPSLMSRDGETGVWDIGRGAEDKGIITVRVPVATTAGSQDAIVRMYVEVIGYVGPVDLPTLHLGDQLIEPAQADVFNQSHPPLGAWYHRVWETDVIARQGSEIEFILRGTYGGSTIDRIAVYVVPEPSTLFFGFLSLGIAYWRRRERISIR